MSESEGAERLWREARSFEGLCELNARFIEGEIHGWDVDHLDSESEPLVPYLAALNRAGLLTTCSQPGMDNGPSKQRAFVDGLALEDTAHRIQRLSLCSDLYIMTSGPGRYNGCMMPITIDEFRPHSWGGSATLHEETGIFTDVLALGEICNESAMVELREAWEVCVIDLCWGRTDYLWSVLANELCVMLNPHEGWGASDDWPYSEKK